MTSSNGMAVISILQVAISRLAIPALSGVLIAAGADAAGAQNCPARQTCDTGVRHALVVGISTYAELGDPSKNLNYAHTDAQAMAAFLRSPAGGSMPTERVRLLVERSAQSDSITYYLRDLWERVGPRDTVILYFAGHAAADNGIGGGTYFLAANFKEKAFDNGSVRFDRLQEYAAAIQAKAARVVLIVDACRSGAIGDARSTNMAPRGQHEAWEEVIRIVSSARGELSQEHERWGGGHGAFTYHLLKALHGHADPGNPAVRLEELSQYVRAAVRKETSAAQSPSGSGGSPSDTVHILPVTLASAGKADEAFAGLLASLPRTRAASMQVATRDIEIRRDLSHLEPAVVETMQRLADAVDDPSFASSTADVAWDAYQQLLTMPAAASELGIARNLLVTAFTGPGHRLIARYLEGGYREPSGDSYRRAASLYRRGADLMREDDPSRANYEARRHFLEGYAIVRNRERLRYDEAERLLRRSIELEPEVPYAYNALGLLETLRNRFESAESLLAAAAERAPQWQYPLVNLAGVRLATGDHAGAIAAYHRAIRADSMTAEAYNNLGSVYEALGRYVQAERLYRTAISRDPSYAAAYGNIALLHRRRGNFAAAQAHLDTMAMIEQRDSASVFGLWGALEQGHLHNERLDHVAALAQFRRAQRMAPGYPEPLRHIASTYRMMDSVGRARETLAAALELDPLHAGSHIALAQIDMFGRPPRYSDAERTLLQAREKIPHSIALRSTLGQLYARWAADPSAAAADRAKAARQAEEAYRAALAIDSTDPGIRAELAALLAGGGDFAAAERQLLRAVALNDSSVTARYALAEFYRQRAAADAAGRDGWNDRREAVLREIADLDPEFASVHNALGVIRLERGQFDVAGASFRRAASLGFAPATLRQHAITAQGRGSALAAAGEIAGAAAAYRLAAELDSSNVAAVEGLARASYLAGSAADALRHAERAIRISRDAAQREDLEVLKARILIDLERPADAVAIMERVVPDIDDSFVSPHWLLTTAIAYSAMSPATPEARTRAIAAWRAAVSMTSPDGTSDAELQRHYSAAARSLLARLRASAGNAR